MRRSPQSALSNPCVAIRSLTLDSLPDSVSNLFPRPQFSVRRLLALTAGCAVLFAAFRWLGMPPAASLLVAGLLTASLAAAGLLVLVIARSVESDEDKDR